MRREEVEAEQKLRLMDGSNKHRTGANPGKKMASTYFNWPPPPTELTYVGYVSRVVALFFMQMSDLYFYHYDQRSPDCGWSQRPGSFAGSGPRNHRGDPPRSSGAERNWMRELGWMANWDWAQPQRPTEIQSDNRGHRTEVIYSAARPRRLFQRRQDMAGVDRRGVQRGSDGGRWKWSVEPQIYTLDLTLCRWVLLLISSLNEVCFMMGYSNEAIMLISVG